MPFYAVADMLGCTGYVDHVINRTEARQAANQLADRVSPHLKGMPNLQAFLAVQPAVLVRFHRWEDILKLPQPDANLKIANTMWRFARKTGLS